MAASSRVTLRTAAAAASTSPAASAIRRRSGVLAVTAWAPSVAHRRVGETKADVVRQVVGRGLANRRAQHLYHPEVEGDLRNLVQHPAPARTVIGHRRHRPTLPANT